MILLEFTCSHCGSASSRNYRGSGPRPSLCSNACKVAAWKLRHPGHRVAELQALRERSAAEAAARSCSCGMPLSLHQRKWCSIKCRRSHDVVAKACRSCGIEIAKHAQRCDACRRTSATANRLRNRRSPSARAAKSMRKALHRGSVEGAERFDPVAVLFRDGWKCHLCGRATPQRLRGTYDDRAPELDHIVPLARGGAHTMANTACACRKCNIAKGARPLGQLRLIG